MPLAPRLAAQALSAPLSSVRAVAQRMLALQGQDLGAVRWALGVRTHGATEVEVQQAFDRRELVRAWPLRGTLHVVPAGDLRWLSRFFAARNLARARKRHADLGLDDEVFRRARAVATKALRAGPLTREALLDALGHGGVVTGGQRGAHLFWGLAQHEVLCLGDFDGQDQRFVLQDAWLPGGDVLEGDEALEALARRYLEGHGPSTVEDLAWWAGLTKTEAKRALGLVGEVARPRERAIPEALLLPGFDEYLLGYAQRDAMLSREHFLRVVPGGNGVFRPMVVLDGRIVGTWKRSTGRDGVKVECSFFVKVPAAKKAPLQAAAERFAAFLGKPLRDVTT